MTEVLRSETFTLQADDRATRYGSEDNWSETGPASPEELDKTATDLRYRVHMNIALEEAKKLGKSVFVISTHPNWFGLYLLETTHGQSWLEALVDIEGGPELLNAIEKATEGRERPIEDPQIQTHKNEVAEREVARLSAGLSKAGVKAMATLAKGETPTDEEVDQAWDKHLALLKKYGN